MQERASALQIAVLLGIAPFNGSKVRCDRLRRVLRLVVALGAPQSLVKGSNHESNGTSYVTNDRVMYHWGTGCESMQQVQVDRRKLEKGSALKGQSRDARARAKGSSRPGQCISPYGINTQGRQSPEKLWHVGARLATVAV